MSFSQKVPAFVRGFKFERVLYISIHRLCIFLICMLVISVLVKRLPYDGRWSSVINLKALS